MLRYINDQFNDKHLSTIQAAFMKKKLRIGNNSVELAIWVNILIKVEFKGIFLSIRKFISGYSRTRKISCTQSYLL
jgi:hypothetical protein